MKQNISYKRDEAASKQYCIEVWGDKACFTTPSNAGERNSYPFITPSAAEGIFASIFRKHYAMRWEINKIEIINQGQRGDACMTNGFSCVGPMNGKRLKSEKLQMFTTYMYNVKYRIYATLHYIPIPERVAGWDGIHQPTQDEHYANKYFDMFERRAERGQTYRDLCLGLADCSADYKLVDPSDPSLEQPEDINVEYPVMFWGFDRRPNDTPMALWYTAKVEHGVINVPSKSEVLELAR